MEQFWLDFLTKQVPVVVILGIFSYAMYKYFTAVLDKKDTVILEKEKEIKMLYSDVKDLTVRCLEAFNRNTEALQRNTEAVKDSKK